MSDLICPRCRLKDSVKRCPKDQAYMVSPDAYQNAPKDPLLGYEIAGKYGIIERLGMGGMGAVYKGVNYEKDLTVAVKVLREAYTDHPAIRERFIREAEAGASIQHPNVVPLVDFGIEKNYKSKQGGRLWLAMEYVKGWTVRDEINHNGAFSVKSAIELTRQVLKGLVVAHEAGLIHRDLKHDNIMYYGRRSNFIARIVDFGVVKSEAADLMNARQKRSAKAASLADLKSISKKPTSSEALSAEQSFDFEAAFDEAEQALNAQADPEELGSELTAFGMMVGSPSYMSPEQIRGLKVGPPADLYALAVVIYEVLTARRLFSVNDYEGLLREGAKRDAPLLVFNARGELVPEAFAKLIHRALEHDPYDRYPDAQTMLLALDQMDLRGSSLPPNLFSKLPRQKQDQDLRSNALSSKAHPNGHRTLSSPTYVVEETSPLAPPNQESNASNESHSMRHTEHPPHHEPESIITLPYTSKRSRSFPTVYWALPLLLFTGSFIMVYLLKSVF